MNEPNQAKLHEDAADGHRAAHALEVVGETLASLEAEYIKAWKATPSRDTDARERLWQAVQIVGKVDTHIRKIVSDGKLAERELADIAKADEEKRKRKASRA